jgi:hypothetical protein
MLSWASTGDHNDSETTGGARLAYMQSRQEERVARKPVGHRGPSIADRARTARAVRTSPPISADLRAAGITSLKSVAEALTERRVPTPSGSKYWHPMQVARVLKRLTE